MSIGTSGDNQRPKCKTCQTKNLDCVRPPKKTIFRHWSTAAPPSASASPAASALVFASEQNSNDQHQLSPPRTGSLSQSMPLETQHYHSVSSPQDSYSGLSNLNLPGTLYLHLVDSPSNDRIVRHPSLPSPASCHQPASVQPPISLPLSGGSTGNVSCSNVGSGYSFSTSSPSCVYLQGTPDTCTALLPDHSDAYQPTEDVQEACLLRYFIDELAPWVCWVGSSTPCLLTYPYSSTSVMNIGISSSQSRGVHEVAHPYVMPFFQWRPAALVACRNTARLLGSSILGNCFPNSLRIQLSNTC